MAGGVVDLAELRGRAVLVVFLRHAGWLICRAHLVKVLRLRDTIDRLGATVVFVVHDEPGRVRAALLRELDVPYPVAVDLDRHAYRAWGCRRASFARVWLDPRVWVRYLREALRSGRAPRLGVDTLQLGGDFVVDREGRIAYARPQERDDRPPVRTLVHELEAL